MTKIEILNRILNISQSSFVDENYISDINGEYNTSKLLDDMIEFAIEEMSDYGIPYTEDEILIYFKNNLTI